MGALKNIKESVKTMVPDSLLKQYSATRISGIKKFREMLESSGYIVTRTNDYYAPTPGANSLKKHKDRWLKPSALKGVKYDLDGFALKLRELCAKYLDEFNLLKPYEEIKNIGFGPGYPHVDAFVLYAMFRDKKPKRYLEVGSGMSTYYANCAAEKNRAEGFPSQITCIEPFPYEALLKLEQIELIKSEVQDIPLERFTELESGDFFFIDSSHIIRIDGDVPFLYLEVIPDIQTGVHIHIHDVPFPYNIPYPAELWTTLEHPDATEWPMYWNEAMLLQALLCNNHTLEIEMSTPLLRYFTEKVLKDNIPFYKPVSEEANTFSSLWLLKK